LLVSVSVITLLAGLLLPAVLQARATARRAVCQSNLKQWSLAVRLYADIHEGRLPYRGQGIQPTSLVTRPDDWFNALPPLMELAPYAELAAHREKPQPGQWSVWICPEAEGIDPINSTDQPTFFAYGMNMALSTPYNGRPDHIEKVGPTQTMVYMADGLGPFCSVLPSTQLYSPIARHAGTTVNIAFLDGHVESYLGEKVGCGTGDPERPDIRWFPPNSKWPGPPR
jgi:prepilin-type processing-associated H-X9-DG protein